MRRTAVGRLTCWCGAVPRVPIDPLTYPRRKRLRAPKAAAPPIARFRGNHAAAALVSKLPLVGRPPAADGWAQSTNRGAADTLNGRSVAGAFRGSLLRPVSGLRPALTARPRAAI